MEGVRGGEAGEGTEYLSVPLYSAAAAGQALARGDL